MKVSDLIKILKDCEPNAKVVVSSHSEATQSNILKIGQTPTKVDIEIN